jgi:hypothetical protein
MKSYKLFATAAAVFALATAPLSAQGKSGNAPKGGGPKTTASTPKGNSASSGPKSPNAGGGPKASAPTTNASAPTTTATTTTASAPKGQGHGLGLAKKTGAAPTTATASTTTGGTSTSTTTTPTTTTATTTTTPSPLPTTPNKVSTKLTANPAQLAKVTAMLPEGMSLEQASAGFRNQGQFIAALNASKNRGLLFADLQKAMTVDGMSLGQAAKYVQTLPPPVTPPPTGTTPTGTTPTGTTPTTTPATTTSTTTTTAPKS